MRGKVQADILKEDQAQNTCIFSTEFALRVMGDIQQHFIDHKVRNFYSVSISGYHIAEAGANPVSQLAGAGRAGGRRHRISTVPVLFSLIFFFLGITLLYAERIALIPGVGRLCYV